jgi:dTMP kinase
LKFDEKIFESKVLKPGSAILGEGTALERLKLREPDFSLLSIDERMGKYVAIEGIDGSGKTTLSTMLCQHLKMFGKLCETVKEPFYEEVKSLLAKMPNMNPIAEAYLFAADRLLMHSTELVKLLKDREKRIIIGDRSYLASLVYQTARGAPLEVVLSLNSYALEPDLVILLDVDPNIAWERLKKKDDRQLRHLEDKEKFQKLRENYLWLARAITFPPIVVIDASPPPEEVLEDSLNVLRRKGII